MIKSTVLYLAIIMAMMAVAVTAVVPTDNPVPCPTPDPGDARAVEVHLRCLLSTLGNPIILPNPFPNDNRDDPEGRGDAADQELFEAFCQNVDRVLGELENARNRADGANNKGGRAAIDDLEEFVRAASDAANAVKDALERAAENDDCSGLFEDGNPDCSRFRALQNDQTPAGGTDAETELQQFSLNGHLVPFPRFGTPHRPHERAFEGQVPANGARVVTKEFFGLKARFFIRWVPIWVEPWYSRRRIIGWRPRVYIRWVPCEYIKSIIYQDFGDQSAIVPRVTSTEHCDFALLQYWRYF